MEESQDLSWRRQVPILLTFKATQEANNYRKGFRGELKPVSQEASVKKFIEWTIIDNLRRQRTLLLEKQKQKSNVSSKRSNNGGGSRVVSRLPSINIRQNSNSSGSTGWQLPSADWKSPLAKRNSRPYFPFPSVSSTINE